MLNCLVLKYYQVGQLQYLQQIIGVGMTIRNNMAKKLHTLCEHKKSIAQVCRELGINRQQFNKYLAGQSMPNASSLNKICTYFKISEDELFSDAQASMSFNSSTIQNLMSSPGFQRTLQNISIDPPVSLHPGIYYTYFVLLDENPVKLTRTVVALQRDNGILTFRRLTNFAETSSSRWHNIRGDHTGLVIERAHWFYFIGFAYHGTGEPSMIAVQWLPISSKILSGTALVGDDSGPRSFPILMEEVPPSLTIRQALKKSNVVSLSSIDINPHIRNVINHKIRQNS